MWCAGFIVLRMLIGVSLSMFVVTQYWCTAMFNTKIIGSVTAVAAGWGNVGGGASLFIMPVLVQALVHGGSPEWLAWRWSFFVPGSLQLLLGITALLGSDDTPEGPHPATLGCRYVPRQLFDPAFVT